VRGPDYHNPQARLLCLENTHNRAGGVVIPLAAITAAADAAHAKNLRVHLDGARLWNAAVASGIALDAWARPADTVMMCFSKGLGAPVGSILVGGPRDDRARAQAAQDGRRRHSPGRCARAACLYALDHHIERLSEDHRRARRLAELVAGAQGLAVDPAAIETNIVLIEVTDPAWTPDRASNVLRERGLLVEPFGARTLRAVTHLDVDDAAIERAGGILRGLREAAPSAA
jgi:threonine aldolase